MGTESETAERRNRIAMAAISTLLALAVVGVALRPNPDLSLDGAPSSHLVQTALVEQDLTLAAITMSPDELTEESVVSTEVAEFETALASGGTPTIAPTVAAAEVVGTLESVFADGGARMTSVEAAAEILRLDPDADVQYVDFLVANARVAASDSLPMPYEGAGAGDGWEQSDEEYYQEVLTEEFRAACQDRANVNYGICMREALVDYPEYMRMLVHVPENDALPVAHLGVLSPNPLVVHAATHVACHFGDTSIVTVLEQRILEVDWPVPDLALATELLYCDDESTDSLALDALDGDEDTFEILREAFLGGIVTPTPE